MKIFGTKKEENKEKTYRVELSMRSTEGMYFNVLSFAEAMNIITTIKNTKEGFVLLEVEGNDDRYHSAILLKIEELIYAEIMEENEENEEDENDS